MIVILPKRVAAAPALPYNALTAEKPSCNTTQSCCTANDEYVSCIVTVHAVLLDLTNHGCPCNKPRLIQRRSTTLRRSFVLLVSWSESFTVLIRKPKFSWFPSQLSFATLGIVLN
ncbi:hypothetical protein NL676_032129 [Syzygium grande]|nr:hypothetical protein NL676_032129 [Syzygium grande]